MIALDQPEPQQAEVLGSIEVKGSGLSATCDYRVVVDKAKLEARKYGGNVIKIISHRLPEPPALLCHQIVAQVFNVENINDLRMNIERYVSENTTVAQLNVYSMDRDGSLTRGYVLHLGDTVLCEIKPNVMRTFHLKEPGPIKLWAMTETKEEVVINVERGATYYLRCGMKKRGFGGQPELKLMDPPKGMGRSNDPRSNQQ